MVKAPRRRARVRESLAWRDVRHPVTGRLLFRYDPWRRVIEIQQRRQKVEIALEDLEK